ncbi:MAG: hypothetical protein QOK17_1531 [Sphingomonadales bacterium]|jgi:DGQHR domain-containing protein|nr:hypothetical protein [Sphingomonadales bacterium]
MAEVLKLPVLKVPQPIGEVYISGIRAADLWRIAEADIGDIARGKDGIYAFTGIQRKLNQKRVDEIAAYVQTVDATFPTAIVLAASSEIAVLNADGKSIELKADLPEGDDDISSVFYKPVVRIIDGQHRIAGLKKAAAADFYVNIALLIDADMEDQARVFSIVNLAQTKVNRSLVYELFGYSTSWSPEKCAHDVCVSLDKAEGSPFHNRIKRLGSATPGRDTEETFSQALVVEGILSHIVLNQIQLIEDRDRGLRSRSWPRLSPEESRRLVLRPFFLAEDDLSMAQILWNYFDAVQTKWPKAWEARGRGDILGRTNGFRALMRLFRNVYNELAMPGDMVSKTTFDTVFARSKLSGSSFTTEYYPPGTSGESRLFNDLKLSLGYE